MKLIVSVDVTEGRSQFLKLRNLLLPIQCKKKLYRYESPCWACSVGAMSMIIAISKILLNFIAFGFFFSPSNHEIISRDIRMIENKRRKIGGNQLFKLKWLFLLLLLLLKHRHSFTTLETWVHKNVSLIYFGRNFFLFSLASQAQRLESLIRDPPFVYDSTLDCEFMSSREEREREFHRRNISRNPTFFPLCS